MSNGESNASEVWQSVAGYIRAKSEDVYKQWFKKMVPISIDVSSSPLFMPVRRTLIKVIHLNHFISIGLPSWLSW